MKIVNIGIVAHVDAGKTSLTERILFETKVIDKIGRVDAGTTQTDSLDLEKRRGITIKASVVSFPVQDIKVNLIDTPGHADFIAEVERSFSVLDGAVLVISAVEGIQAQTKFLMSILVQLGIPTILFINKIDRMGAQAQSLIEQIKEKLTDRVLPLYTPENLGTKEASIGVNCFNSTHNPAFVEAAIDLLAQHDEELLAAYVNGETLSEAQLTSALTRQVKSAKLYPIFFGSAMTGVGVGELLKGVATFFPTNSGAEDEPLSAVVFKIEREASGEKIAYLRLYSGTIYVRQDPPLRRKRDADESELRSDKVKKLHLFRAGKSVQFSHASAGDFCKIWGLRDIRIGDVVGDWCDRIRDLHFVSPQMEARIEPSDPAQNHHLFYALTQLSEEDPLIKVIRDTFHHELYLRFFGEVQKEVLETMLLERYGLTVGFSETRVVCIEKPIGTGQAFELMGAGNPFVATVGFRVEPGAPGSGITYSYEVQLGSLPLVLHRTIEATVLDVLKQGIYGWEVVDIAVILTHTGYNSVATTAGDFRLLVPLVLMAALVEAGTEVYEPLNEFELSAPTHALSTAMYKLTLVKAIFEQPILRSDSFVLTGTLPAATTEEFKRELYTFAGGEGIFVTKPAGFRKIEGEFPTRKRADNNPLNRKEYLFNAGR